MGPIEPAGPFLVETGRAETGGGAVGHLADGRVVFVDGALPDERVAVELTEERERFARGRVVEVVASNPDRVVPPCPALARGCGGCDLQHATPDLQRSMKEQVVADALARIGRLPTLPTIEHHPLPPVGFRTTVRAAVADGGRAAFRHHHSHDLVVPDDCLIAHPAAEALLVGGRFEGCDEVVVRVGAATGERMVVGAPDAGGIRLPDGCDDVVVVGRDEAAEAFLHEDVGGRRWRISGRSFFQTRPDGAEALVAVVRRDVAEAAGRPDRLVDLCAGVGLFAGTVESGQVEAVESSRASVADALHNLADLGDAATVVRSAMERWRPSPADVVVADPPRTGLRRAGVDRIAATSARLVVLVSCDAGSLGRDAGLLRDAGYRLERVTLVDLFPQSHHVEVVSRFVSITS
jgi:23S rRNA (uracil1939-C5)-methyltransferase